jgi:arginase
MLTSIRFGMASHVGAAHSSPPQGRSKRDSNEEKKENSKMQKNSTTLWLGIIGVPTNSSGTTEGVARAPQALRRAGLIDTLQHVSDVKDYGDVAVLAPTSERSQASGIIAEESLLSMTQDVQQAVGRALTEGRFPLVIGGDCPLLLGCLAAARSRLARTGLLFVDGHEDAYPPHQSPTGEAADMELGLALGSVPAPGLPAELARLLPLVRPQEVRMLGMRDAAVLRTEGVRSLAEVLELYDDQALQGEALVSITQAALRHLQARIHRWWLHVDLDVLSTEALSAIDYPQPGGLSWRQLETLTATALAAEGLVGWDITIYNPDLDPDGSQAVRIVEYLVGALAHLPTPLR